METYKLIKEINFNGEPIKQLNLDLDGLTITKLENCEKEVRARWGNKSMGSIPETNKKYLSCVAAKAAGVPVELIRKLGAKDYVQVTLKVMNFLLDGDSDSEEMEETEASENTEATDLTTTTETSAKNESVLESPKDSTN